MILKILIASVMSVSALLQAASLDFTLSPTTEIDDYYAAAWIEAPKKKTVTRPLSESIQAGDLGEVRTTLAKGIHSRSSLDENVTLAQKYHSEAQKQYSEAAEAFIAADVLSSYKTMAETRHNIVLALKGAKPCLAKEADEASARTMTLRDATARTTTYTGRSKASELSTVRSDTSETTETE